VEGASEGKLKGRTVVLKDNVMLAGVPMMNGSSTLEGYTPDVDATVVSRILDAGGVILGKSQCEAFCLSGGSHTNSTGPVHNPHKMGYSAGGSSSGSAVLVALGEADMAIGGDQGGSIRIPATPRPSTSPPSRDGDPLRDERWAAGQHDVGGEALRRADDLPRRPRLRASGRLEADVSASKGRSVVHREALVGQRPLGPRRALHLPKDRPVAP
jgi:hypothetical protein